MLYEVAHNFPRLVAELLERDRSLTRNFREEMVTDLLMASLVGLESFGIRVDFPDEPTTGGDMDWIYAAPCEINDGRYLRLILQAKRAQYAKLKSGGYWFYQHLDHGDPPGQQAQTLTDYAATSPDGMSTLPLYILYHPASALIPAARSRPAVEGVNILFASKVVSIVKGGCRRDRKKVDYWRNDFLPLSDLLCWPVVALSEPPLRRDVTQFLVGQSILSLNPITSGFHPDLIARRLQDRRDQGPRSPASDVDERESPPITPSNGIPDHVRRAIDGKVTAEDRKRLKRPRVILTTTMTREDPIFSIAERAARSRQD